MSNQDFRRNGHGKADPRPHTVQTHSDRNRERRRKKLSKSVVTVLVICCVLAFSWVGYTASYVAPLLFGDLSGDLETSGDPDVEKINGQMTILLMGWDHRKNETVGRSDTMMVAFVDLDKKIVRLLSIPRDSLVSIPGYTPNKINHAFAYGGIELSKATLEQDFGIKPDYTVLVDFQGFRDIIDAIGGVTIEVPMHMYNPIEAIDIEAGMQTLNGKKALQFVRYRDDKGDIERVKRQQEFMLVLKNQLLSAGTLTDIPALCEAVANNVQTDMNGTLMVQMLVTLGSSMTMETYQPEGQYQYVNGGWYFYINEDTKDAFFKALTNFEDTVPYNSNYAEQAMEEGSEMGADGTATDTNTEMVVE